MNHHMPNSDVSMNTAPLLIQLGVFIASMFLDPNSLDTAEKTMSIAVHLTGLLTFLIYLLMNWEKIMLSLKKVNVFKKWK